MSSDLLTPSGDGAPVPGVCSIPLGSFHAFPGCVVILRTDNPAELTAQLGPAVPERVAFVQLTDLRQDMGPLADWGEGLAIDLVMRDPAAETPLLYRCTCLLERHPVRVTIPLLPGVSGAVKLALSLGISARLSGHQPGTAVVEEVCRALDSYLHNPTVSQTVEPFHSLLLACLQHHPVNLWQLLERDTGQLRMFDDGGKEAPDAGPASVAAFRDTLVAAGGECRGCEWLAVCGGYFKWPETGYACAEVKRMLAGIQAAADELRQELAAYEALHSGMAHGV